jgi:soluble lytic murein transglycosylase-like protein
MKVETLLGPESVLPYDDAEYGRASLRGVARVRTHPTRPWLYALSLLVCGLVLARGVTRASYERGIPIMTPIVVAAPARAEWVMEYRSDTVANMLIKKNVDHVTATRWARDFVRYADEVKVSPKLLVAIAYAESEFNPRARSRAGAIGLMQVLPEPDSWREYEPRCGEMTVQSLHDPRVNICFGAHILREFLTRHNDDTDHALSAYNNGSGKLNGYPDRVYASLAALRPAKRIAAPAAGNL